MRRLRAMMAQAPAMTTRRQRFRRLGRSIFPRRSASASWFPPVPNRYRSSFCGGLQKIVAAVAGASGMVERKVWQREPRSELIQLPLTAGTMPLDSKRGSEQSRREDLSDRPPGGERAGLPPGTRAISVFVVNERDPKEGTCRRGEPLSSRAAGVSACELRGFVPRPNVRGLRVDDPDERIADLRYADVCEFAVGHGAATHAIVKNGRCDEVRTTFCRRRPSSESKQASNPS